MLVERIVTYGRMIKFSHSVFALPFAFSGAALAALEVDISLIHVFWIAVAMVGARSAAMGFNRLVDRDVDAANPRTAARELPRGLISPGTVRVLIAISSAALVLAAWQLNPLCFALSPVALGIVFFYSYTKRFTWATQFFLGLALSVAPIGAWIAITGRLGCGDPAAGRGGIGLGFRVRYHLCLPGPGVRPRPRDLFDTATLRRAPRVWPSRGFCTPFPFC